MRAIIENLPNLTEPQQVRVAQAMLLTLKSHTISTSGVRVRYEEETNDGR